MESKVVSVTFISKMPMIELAGFALLILAAQLT